MDKVVILKDNRIVKINFDSSKFEFYTTGHLAGFIAGDNNHYRYTIDEKASINGYVDYSKYLSYRAGVLKNPNDITVFNSWEPAEVGDELLVIKRVIELTTHQLNFPGNNYKWITYTKLVDDNLIKSNFSFIDTESFSIKDERINDNGAINNTAFIYFKNNIINAYLNNKWDNEYAEVIADITQTIDNIEENIYTAFISNDPLFDIILKEKQQLRWKDIYKEGYIGSSEELKKIYYNNYNDLSKYNEVILNYLELFKNGKDIERSIAIAAGLHPSVLMLIPVKKKLEMIKHICTKYFVNSFKHRSGYANQYSEQDNSLFFINKEVFQKLIVNLTISFDEQSENIDSSLGMSPINYFLDELLKTIDDGYIYIDHPTLYEVIYKNLNQSLNISEGFIAISNAVFKTNFRPNNSKSAFVQAVYLLWLRSKYNPYNEDGTLKPILHFTSKNTTTTPFNQINNESNFIEYQNPPIVNPNTFVFKYTNETAYQTKKGVHPEGEWPYQYAGNTEYFYTIPYPDAAPITIPYQSEKKIGIYRDNFSFGFNGDKIQAYQEKLPALDVDDELFEGFSKYSQTTKLYGTYHIYQPVTLINSNVETKAPIPMLYGTKTEVGDGNLTINSLIPIFVLKMIDDIGDQSDTETVVGYLVDGILTFSGIGNLTKLRHLKWAALGASEEAVGLLTKQGLRVVLGGVEFTSGALGFFANFVECNANDEFCKNVKNFIMLLQLATLSVTAVDTVASLALKTSAKKITQTFEEGLTPEVLRQKVKERLQQLNPNAEAGAVDEASRSIVLSAFAPLDPDTIKLVIKKIRSTFKGQKWKIDPTYTDTFLTDYIKLCKENLNLTDDVVTDLIVVANRNNPAVKFITTDELVLQTKFYVNEILKRGFSAGFSDLAHYKQFCNAFKNKLLQNFNEMPGNLSHYFNDAEFVMQGSATRTWKAGDPAPAAGIVKPTKSPGDVDVGIVLQPGQYNSFKEDLKMSIIKMIDNKTIDRDIGANIISKIDFAEGDKLLYNKIFQEIPIDNSFFAELIKESGKNFTNFKPKEINFAIIKKYGKSDILPNVTFKY